jgi:hypothetical protein
VTLGLGVGELTERPGANADGVDVFETVGEGEPISAAAASNGGWLEPLPLLLTIKTPANTAPMSNNDPPAARRTGFLLVRLSERGGWIVAGTATGLVPMLRG